MAFLDQIEEEVGVELKAQKDALVKERAVSQLADLRAKSEALITEVATAQVEFDTHFGVVPTEDAPESAEEEKSEVVEEPVA